MLIRLFNPNDLIGCGGDINQSDSVGLHRSTQVYAGLHGSTWGSTWVCTGLHGGLFLRGGGEKIRILC